MAAVALAASSLNAQMTMNLNGKQQALVAIAAQEAKGNIEGLKVALNEGFDDKLTISEAKEALSHLYAYTGFPRSLNALGALQQVIKEREASGMKTEPGRDADPLPSDYDALKQGTEVQTKLTGVPFNYEFAPQADYYLKAHLFVNGARNMGVTDGQLRDIPTVLWQKVGEAEAARARKAVAQVLDKTQEAAVQTVDFNVWPKGDPNDAYAQYFIGNSYLADMGGGIFNVTFEPGCRNNWHVHHKQVQVLICVAGRGWYQEWGKDPVPMTPGTVIAIPAEAKHWHGAARDSWFQHLTIHKDVQPGASNEWLEPVTDDIYPN